MDYGTLRSPAMRGAHLRYSVWAPKDLAADERLPLVVLLHGGGDDVGSFERHGSSAAFDAALEAGELPRMIVALPEGDLGFWANWRDGSRRYRDWVLDDLMPAVARRYHTRACPEGCHLVGVSMGGSGVVSFLLNRPGVFASAAALSAPIFDARRMRQFSQDRLMRAFIPIHRIWGEPTPRELRRQDPFQRWRSAQDLRGTRLTLAYARHDRPGIAQGNDQLHRVLRERDIPHDYFVFEGHHAWVSWTPVFARVLRADLGRSP